jgi:hypothetical protein
MKTQKEVRASFWNDHPQFKNEYRKTYTQNQYCTDIRVTFCDYVDYLLKSGIISEKLADRVTL